MADPKSDAPAVEAKQEGTEPTAETKPDSPSLFLRTHESPTSDQNAPAIKAETAGAAKQSEFPVNIRDASGKGSSGESLFTGIMSEAGARKDYTQIGKSPKFEKGSTADQILTGFDLVDKSPKESKSLHSKEISDKGLKNTLNRIKESSNNSSEAALIDLSNNLADHKELLPRITDSEGKITSKSIDRALRADAADQESGNSTLSPEQRESLLKALSSFSKANEFKMPDGKSLGQKGLSKDQLKGMSTPELEEKLKQNLGEPIDPSHPDKLMPPGMGESHSNGDDRDKRDSEIPPSSTGGDSTISEQPVGPKAEKKPVEQLAQGEFTTVGKIVLEKLDKDKTGKVTKEQLAKALEDPSFTGKEAQALAALYRNFDQLKDISGQQRFYEFKGINSADLDKFEEIERSQNARTDGELRTYLWAQSNLSRFSDGTGSLKQTDIERALSDPKTTGQDRTELEKLQKSFSEYKKDEQGGINLKSMLQRYENSYGDTPEAKVVSGVWGSAYNTNQSQKPENSRDLYATPESPLQSITPEAVRQGYIGNCYFEAALGAVANSNPEAIRQMIKDNGDGTYTVTFPGAPNEPITIKAPTEAEQGIYNQGSPHGLWASVMEKAYGKYRDNHNWISANTPQEGADGGGLTAQAMEFLTGKPVENISVKDKPQDIARALEEAFSSNPPKEVTASVSSDGLWAKLWGTSTDRTADKFIKQHAYTITGFTPDGKGGGSITIRNPHAQGAGPDGTTTIPLEQFIKNFDYLRRIK